MVVLVVVTVVVLGLGCGDRVEADGGGTGGRVYVKQNSKQTCLGPAPTTSTTTVMDTTRRTIKGVIAAPDRPGQVNCQWVIVNPHQKTLLLSFTRFDLSAGCCDGDPSKCCYQWLTLGTDTPGGRRGWWKRGHHHNTLTPHHSTLPHHNPFISHQSSINLSHNNCNDVGEGSDVLGAGQVCGAVLPRPTVTQAPRVLLTYYSSPSVDVKSLSSPRLPLSLLSPLSPTAVASAAGQSGFRMEFYTVSNSSVCGPDEFTCTNPHLCVPLTLRCDGRLHCPDHSDEETCAEQQKHQQKKKKKKEGSCLQEATTIQCDGAWQCPDGQDEKGCPGCGDDQWWCGMGRECYSEAQRCDGTAHCSNSMDELSCNPACPRHVSCWSGGCYQLSQRCDGSPDCGDASDETNCSPALCNEQHGTFLCNNQRCIRETWQCNQLDDCRDGSDEQDCLRNSVIGVAAMGGLACSLLLVVAVGCTGRLYALRMGLTRIQGNGSGGQRGSGGRGPAAPRSRLEEHLLQREMPPPYDVAVNDRSTPLFGSCGDWQQWQRRRSSVPQERADSPLVPVYGGAPPLDPHHHSNTQGLTMEIEIQQGGREGPEKMEEGAGESAFFATHEGDVPLLTSLVGDACHGDGGRGESDDVPLLQDLTSTSTSTTTSSASSDCDVESDREDLGSVSEGSEEAKGDVGKTAPFPDLPDLLHVTPQHPPHTPHTHNKTMGIDVGIGPLGEGMGRGGNVSYSSSFFPKAGERQGEEVMGKGDCASPSRSSPFFAGPGEMLGDGAVGKGDCASPFFPFPEGMGMVGDEGGDVLLSDTRAAVLALSAVQSHMDNMTRSDTEMMCQ